MKSKDWLSAFVVIGFYLSCFSIVTGLGHITLKLFSGAAIPDKHIYLLVGSLFLSGVLGRLAISMSKNAEDSGN